MTILECSCGLVISTPNAAPRHCVRCGNPKFSYEWRVTEPSETSDSREVGEVTLQRVNLRVPSEHRSTVLSTGTNVVAGQFGAGIHVANHTAAHLPTV